MNFIRRSLNIRGKLFLAALALTFILMAPVLIESNRSVQAQPSPQAGDYQAGDYRSIDDGNWTDPSIWEICTNAEYIEGKWLYKWNKVTNYPGQTGYEGNYAVTIQSGNVISDNNVRNLSFGNLLVAGHLSLSNDLNLVNTGYVLVDGQYYDGSDITTGGSIRWLNKLTLSLHENAILNVINVKYTSGEFTGKVIEGLGLHAPHAQNNNMRLKIGNIDYAAGEGGGNVVYIFDDINNAGGALQAIASADPEHIYYIGTATELTTTLTGAAQGLGSGPEYTTFEWTGTGPDAFSFSYNGQNPGTIELKNGYGTYTFKLKVTSDYRGFIYSHYDEVSVTVHQAPLTITALDQTKEYGETLNFKGTEYTVEGLIETDTVSSVTLFSEGAAASTEIGTYAVIPSKAEGIGLENYDITYINGTFSVIKPILTIKALDQSKVYGETLTFAGNEFTTDGLKDGDSITSVTLSSTGVAASVAVGVYAITPGAALGSGLDNYTVIYKPGFLTIGPKALTITADNAGKTYGNTVILDGSEFTSDGLVNGDSITSITLYSDGASAAAAVAGSPYQIVASNATGSGLENYTITYIDGKLNVSKKALTVSADNAGKTYGDMVTFAGTEFTSNGLVNGDSITKVTLYSDGAAATATVNGSPYKIEASNAIGSGLDNYKVTYVDGSLTVNFRVLKITADSIDKTYRDTVTFAGTEFTSYGLVNDDTVNRVTLISNGAAASATVNGSPYKIEVSNAIGSGLENYTATYANGYMTVHPMTIYVTIDHQSKTYGDPDPELTYTYYPELVGIDSFTGELARVAGEDVGTYAITRGSLDLGDNYRIAIQGTLTIEPMVISVTANSKSKNYGEADPAFTYTYSPKLIGNDSFIGSLSREAGENAGTYTIAQGTLELGANYTINYTSADLTIINIPAAFELSNLVITPSTSETWAGITFTRDTNEDVLITVEVSNTGGQSGMFHGVLKLNGEEVISEDITLEAGQSGQLTFNISDLPAGDYTVDIEELRGEFSRDNWINWWLISTLMLTVVFIGYLVKRFGLDGESVNWSIEEGEN